MPFVVVSFRGEEVTRRELTGPLVIGRAPECDVAVRDIILSRRHCRITPTDGGLWAVEDLGSKNGTRINGDAVQFSVLEDGTAVRIGKTQVKYYKGSLKPAAVGKRPGTIRRRPADPFEALSGTVTDFEFVPDKTRDLSRLPTPLPKPADPASYAKEDVYTMLTEIASSSWDSIYATASGPAAVMVAGQTQKLPTAGVKATGTDLPPRRRNVVTDPSLQVDHSEPSSGMLTSVTTAAAENPGSTSVDFLSTLAASSDVMPLSPAASPVPTEQPRVGRMRRILRGLKHVITGRFLHRES